MQKKVHASRLNANGSNMYVHIFIQIRQEFILTVRVLKIPNHTHKESTVWKQEKEDLRLEGAMSCCTGFHINFKSNILVDSHLQDRWTAVYYKDNRNSCLTQNLSSVPLKNSLKGYSTFYWDSGDSRLTSSLVEPLEEMFLSLHQELLCACPKQEAKNLLMITHKTFFQKIKNEIYGKKL